MAQADGTAGTESVARGGIGTGRTGAARWAEAGGKRERDEWRVRQSLKYRWRVSGRCGPWREFDGSELVRKLAGRRLLIVGDSLNAMLFAALRNALFMGRNSTFVQKRRALPPDCVPSDSLPGFCERWGREIAMRAQHALCAEERCADASVAFVRSDALDPSPKLTLAWPKLVSFPWLHVLNGSSGAAGGTGGGDAAAGNAGAADSGAATNGNVSNRSGDQTIPLGESEPKPATTEKPIAAIILNRGAHYTEDEQFVSQLNVTLAAIRAAAPHTLIVYRNTPPGHAHCKRHSKPFRYRQEAAQLPYHWGDFGRQNELARGLVERHGGVYWDVDTATGLRPDGHVRLADGRADCLHYCLPGPADTWVQMLFNILLDLL
ncbi:hypothetical protein CLOP_g21566 [Closterium sp. NIES-67]|nr:hypothetical protein CLOP_g21566 [Closterium sp. NIES-67]